MSARRDWQRVIVRLLREAFITAKILRGRGCWPASYGSSMPDYIRDYFEAYGMEAVRVQAPPPTGAQIDRLDRVIASMSTPRLTVDERQLLWDRAGGKSWKEILPRLQCPERTGKRRYSLALATFALRYVEVERTKNKIAA